MVPADLLRHRSGYQQFLYDDMETIVADFRTALTYLEEIMHDTLRTNRFNETAYLSIKDKYFVTIENFNYNFQLFRDAIVYRSRDLIEQYRGNFRKMNDTLNKELGDTRMTIFHTLSLLNKMKEIMYRGEWGWSHYSFVIMSAIVSQIIGVSIVCSTVCPGAGQTKYQSSSWLAFVWEIHVDRWIPHTKGQ